MTTSEQPIPRHNTADKPAPERDQIPAGVFHGGDEVPPGTFH